MTPQANQTLGIIGKNLLRLRKASGYSQERLALDAEIDRTYVSQIERGIANPSVLVLKKISDCLGVALSDLTLGA
ncbi:MAG: putative transcription regulator protein [Acidimicrobiaceae bacterium]|nr:putative transcription regulator protein [Acidimicrobiaceae bacterium]